MEVMHEVVCGLDVHSRRVQAGVRKLVGKAAKEEVRTFYTMTKDILELSDWLASEGVTHVAMESTGVYWKPLYNILEGRFKVLLVNARHVKNVPGRKTDVRDCQWLAQLLQYGLVRGSFVPEREQRELRDLTRHRAQLVAQRAAVVNRIHKTLEDANIKLGVMATDILGVSGKEMLRALIEGAKTPEEMAQLARGRMKAKIAGLEAALRGHVTEHHRFVLEELMDQLEDLEGRVDRFTQRIEEVSSNPFGAAIEALMELPGFDRRTAENLLAETGDDMSRFPTDKHFCSWAGICPGSNESGGKRKSGKTNNGSRWLKATLVQAAWAASRTKNSYFRQQYRRLCARRGKKRALVAVAHSLLVVIYHVLATGMTYKDLGADYFDNLDSSRIVRSHVKRLERLGYTVTLVREGEAA